MPPEALAKGGVLCPVEAMGGLRPDMYFVYLLRLSDGRYYTGSTPDLRRRLKQHQDGLVISTKDQLPVKLVWYSVFANRLLARRFEAYMKSGSGQAFRNKRLVDN